MKKVHNLVEVDRKALMTVNSSSVCKDTLSKLHKPTIGLYHIISSVTLYASYAMQQCLELSIRRDQIFFTSVSALNKSGNKQLNSIFYLFTNREVILVESEKDRNPRDSRLGLLAHSRNVLLIGL